MLSAVYDAIYESFWSEWFWLPENVTWESFKGPLIYDLVYAVYAAIFLSILRLIICKYIFLPLGLFLGLKLPTKSNLAAMPELEKIYQSVRRPSAHNLQLICKKFDIGALEATKWFKQRRNIEKYPVLIKFSESGWKFVFYLSSFLYGLYCLHNQAYFTDTLQFYEGYPRHVINESIFAYYMVELGYYIAGIFWIFSEVKRKDFKVMLFHHLATIYLITFSYITNFFRIGAVIIILHDASDFWLEGAKMFKYVGFNTSCALLFTIFVVVWIVTRLYLFPFKVIYSIVIQEPQIIGFFPIISIFVIFLLSLQVLHLFWSVLIAKTALQPLIIGRLVSDDRSDSEMSDLDDKINDEERYKPIANGCA